MPVALARWVVARDGGAGVVVAQHAQTVGEQLLEGGGSAGRAEHQAAGLSIGPASCHPPGHWCY
jgi:hypothetical protein